MGFFRSTLVLAIFIACVSCSDSNSGSEQVSSNQLSSKSAVDSSAVSTTVRRVLTALEQHPHDATFYANGGQIEMSVFERQLLTIACQEKLGFEVVIPTNGITSAREIKIPVEHLLVDPTVTVSRSHTEKGGVERVGEVFINLPDKTFTYQEPRKLKGNYRVRGTCIGSEYIISQGR